MKTRNIGDTVVPKRRPELKSEIIMISKDHALNTLYILANGGRYIEDELEPQAEDYLESQDFYDLMQCYRIADQADQANVIRRFEAVKEFIREESVGIDSLYLLQMINHTIIVHGKVDEGTPLHQGIIDIIKKYPFNKKNLTSKDLKDETRND